MKPFKIMFGLSLMLVGCSVFAAENRNAVEEIAETMAKAYIQSASQEAATKVIENLASQASNTDQTGKLGTALAIYGLYENNRSYQRSTSDSQRYQAAAHATATLITMMVPPAGAAAQVVVFCQDLAAEYIFISYKVDLAKLEMEISSFEKQKSELILKQWKSEASGFSFFLAREAALAELIDSQRKTSLKGCKIDDWADPKILKGCLENLLLLGEYLTLQESTIQRILSYQGRFVRFQDFLANGRLGLTVAELQSKQIEMGEQNRSIRMQFTKIYKALSEARVSQIEDRVLMQGREMACENEMLKIELKIAKLQSSLRKEGDKDFLAILSLEQAEDQKAFLEEQGCKL